MMQDCSTIADNVARKKEVNRLAALRSRRIRKERMERQSSVINELQTAVRGLTGGYSEVVCHVTRLVEITGKIVAARQDWQDGGAVGGSDVIDFHDTVEKLGDLFDAISSRDFDISNSDFMLYRTYDV